MFDGRHKFKVCVAPSRKRSGTEINMDNNTLKTKNSTSDKASGSSNVYDDGNIPQTDLPKDIIPDEVPRKDGPGGEK